MRRRPKKRIRNRLDFWQKKARRTDMSYSKFTSYVIRKLGIWAYRPVFWLWIVLTIRAAAFFIGDIRVISG